MVISCSAYGCTNRWKKDGKIQFHRFPLDNPELLHKWIVATKRKSWTPTKSSFLCSLHFADGSYKSSSKRYLKNGAVPSIFNFSTPMQKKCKKERQIIVKQHLPVSMSNNYTKQLDDVSKARYIEKLTYNGEVLPDPLDKVIRSCAFTKNSKIWPPILFGDVYMHLIEEECTNTGEQFKNYKALDCYNYFLSGRVKNILSYWNDNLKVCILTCDVQDNQSTRTIHNPWALITATGIILSGHCTCMAGLDKVCSHVAALLVTVEVANSEGVGSSPSILLSCLKNERSKNEHVPQCISLTAVPVENTSKIGRKVKIIEGKY